LVSVVDKEKPNRKEKREEKESIRLSKGCLNYFNIPGRVSSGEKKKKRGVWGGGGGPDEKKARRIIMPALGHRGKKTVHRKREGRKNCKKGTFQSNGISPKKKGEGRRKKKRMAATGGKGGKKRPGEPAKGEESPRVKIPRKKKRGVRSRHDGGRRGYF